MYSIDFTEVKVFNLYIPVNTDTLFSKQIENKDLDTELLNLDKLVKYEIVDYGVNYTRILFFLEQDECYAELYCIKQLISKYV